MNNCLFLDELIFTLLGVWVSEYGIPKRCTGFKIAHNQSYWIRALKAFFTTYSCSSIWNIRNKNVEYFSSGLKLWIMFCLLLRKVWLLKFTFYLISGLSFPAGERVQWECYWKCEKSEGKQWWFDLCSIFIYVIQERSNNLFLPIFQR